MAAGTRVAGLLIALAVAGCGGARVSPQQQGVLACLRSAGWNAMSHRHARDGSPIVVVRASDGHASVELTFRASAAAARRSLPGITPIGEGWEHNVTYRSTTGFTYADEQAVLRCLT